MSGTDGGSDQDYIIEFTQIGGSVKVTAMDPATLVEASIIGPANVDQSLLTRQAVRKLRYVLKKRASMGPGASDE